MFIRSEQHPELNEVWEAAATALDNRGVLVGEVAAAPGSRGHRFDLLVTLSARRAQRAYVVEVTRRPSTAVVAALPPAVGDHGVLLVAPYLPPAVQAACRGSGIDYVDTLGNMRLDLGDALIEIAGQRPDNPRETTGGTSPRMFRPSGLKLVFALLCEPGLAAAPYRTLAAESRTSLGSVQWVMGELVEAGFIEEQPARALRQTRQLFDRWVEAYAANLYPQRSRNLFAAVQPDRWRAGVERLEDAVWGGETAAYLADGYLRPARATVYLDALTTDFILRHRLRRDDADWTVELRRRFWGDRVAATARAPHLAPSPLVYADLVADGDSRLIDAARRLRESDETLRRVDAH